MTARMLGDGRGCRAYGGCRPGQRCPEHTTDPIRLGDLLGQVANLTAQRGAR
ncbi:hypothetical protein M3G91_10235 [Micromonospora chalcea]|uniref:hypothetical protein n=1 Tax=Micromonospora chalcea TaxID=1874 RepID=UPI0021A3BEC9|nr:hypothetical protein [Micromonospora chalcea]MCT2278003.1 hypothetical protein [Micromonospora chalcea]